MQPDQQNSQWRQDSTEPDNSNNLGVYTPKPDSETGYKSPTSDQQPQTEIDDQDLVHWSAPERPFEKKTSLWFLILIIVALGLIAIDIFWLKSYTFSALIAVMLVALIIHSSREPQTINYTLSGQHGLYVDNTLHPFEEFKAFGVVIDKNINNLIFIPTKRFSTSLSLILPTEVGEQVVDILGARLPMQTIKTDFIDIIVKKLHL